MTYFAYILLLGITKYTCADEFQVSDNASSWDSARNACTFAVPKLTFTDNDFVFDFNVTEELWIGYVLLIQTFRYIGCIKRGDHAADYDMEKDVGRCFSACKTIIIGMQDKGRKCFCFDQAVRDVQEKCEKPCKYPANTACGNEDEQMISVYERVPEYSSQVFAISAFCKAFDQTSTERWEDCDVKHPYYCSFENGTFQDFDSSKTETWLKASKECFKKTAYLSVPDYVSATVWTPDIRIETIIEYTTSNLVGRCGYVDTDYILKFGNCAEERKSLCQKDMTTSTTPTTEAVTSSVETSMSKATNTQASDENSDGYKTEDNRTSSDVYIGVSVAVAAIIAIGIGLVLFWKKRKQTAGHNDKERSKKNFTNKSYDPAAACSSREGNTNNYDVVEDRNSYYSKVDPSNESKDVIDEEYDTTVNSRQPENHDISKTDNIYNKLDLLDDTYDQTGTSREFTSGRVTSNVYGLNSDGPTENQYGCPDVVSSEGTYNHVGDA